MTSPKSASTTPFRRKAEPAGLRSRQVYLTLFITIAAGWIALPFLTPIAWAAVLATAEWPLFRRANDRFPGHSTLMVAGFIAATALLVIMPLSLAAISLAQESQNALNWLKHVQEAGMPAPGWLEGIPLVGLRLGSWWQQHLASPRAANDLLGSLSASSVIGWTRSIGTEVAKDLGLFLITLAVLATLLARGERIASQMLVVSKRMFGAFGEEFLGRMIGAVRATVNGTMLVSLLEGAIIGVGYAVAGVPQPLLFATLTVMLALIPFGAWLAFGIASLILVGLGSALSGAVLFAFGAVVMTIGDNVVQPWAIGSAVELPFILAMIGAFGGLAAFGLIGLFIGPVIMAALLLVWQQWMSPIAEGPA